MKQVTKRRMACVLPLLLALVACGGGDDSPVSPAPGPAPAPAPGPAPSPSGATPLATPVGAAQGSPSTASLTSAGGTLTSADGKLKLTVPEGALNAPATISIQPIGNSAPGRIGSGYRLQPEGMVFAKPVQISFTYADGDLPGSSADALGVATQKSDGTWRWLDGTLDRTARTVTAATTHFSDWSLVKGFQLRPPTATVKTGGTVPLKLTYCFAPPESGDDLTPIGYNCDDENAPAPLNWAVNWSVNGAPGGNGTVGTVSGNGAVATYTAPAQKPATNPVAVSAEVQGSKGKVLVVSNITVNDDTAAYTGSVSGTASWSSGIQHRFEVSNVRFAPVEVLPGDLVKYAAQGSVTLTTSIPGMSPITEVVPLLEGSTMIVFDPTRDDGRFASRYWFGLAATGSIAPGTLTNVCPEQAAAGGDALPSYTDRATLSGSRDITCDVGGGMTMSHSLQWSLKAGQ